MSRATELLEQATPLPWRVSVNQNFPDMGMYGVAPLPIGMIDRADAALIVYAVNRLPDYEAAVEALAALVERYDGWVNAYERPSQQARISVIGPDVEHARAALARLRDEVPA